MVFHDRRRILLTYQLTARVDSLRKQPDRSLQFNQGVPFSGLPGRNVVALFTL
jgi:hypothetical protein